LVRAQKLNKGESKSHMVTRDSTSGILPIGARGYALKNKSRGPSTKSRAKERAHMEAVQL
jgi:hypothetical protein